MPYRVLGSLAAVDPSGTELSLTGGRQRALLAVLVARRGTVVPPEALAELLWGEHQPARPAAALQSQVSRLRRALGPLGAELVTRPAGYLLDVAADDVDAGRFEARLAAAAGAPSAEALAHLDAALAEWEGPAYGEFPDVGLLRLEAIRLDELRLVAVEDRARALLELDRPGEVVPALEGFVAEHPLRERARAQLMRALYRLGRHVEALRHYDQHRAALAEELGLEPSGELRRLQGEILRHEVGGTGPPATASSSEPVVEPDDGLDRLVVRYLDGPTGPLAHAVVGSGRSVTVVPAWVTSLEVTASGRDPRSSLLARLAAHVRLTLYDRAGTGLSRHARFDPSLDAAVAELEAVVQATGAPTTLLGISGAGPASVALAARRPDLVDGLLLVGTYADGPGSFPERLRPHLVGMVREHWGLGSKFLADLYRPGASPDAALHLARVLRDSADADVAAACLDAIYTADVSAELAEVRAPALVVHYRGDRVIPFAGGQQLAAGLPDATFVALDGGWHLPDAADLDRIVGAICSHLAVPAA